MVNFLDAIEIEIPCENCSRKIKKSIGWIKSHQEFTCPCGTTIVLKTDQVRREIAKVERSLDGFKRSLEKIGKR